MMTLSVCLVEFLVLEGELLVQSMDRWAEL